MNYTKPMVTIELAEYTELIKLKDQKIDSQELAKEVLVAVFNELKYLNASVTVNNMLRTLREKGISIIVRNPTNRIDLNTDNFDISNNPPIKA